MAEEFEFDLDLEEGTQDNKQQDTDKQQGTGIPEGVDPETWALAVALKKAKEDPDTRHMLASALGVNEQQAASQPVNQQPQRVVDPREEELNKKREEIARIEAELAQMPPDDPKRQDLLARLVLLNTEVARLEPIIEMNKKMGTMQQAQMAMMQLLQYANQVLATDPRYAALHSEQKQAIIMGVQNGLAQLLNTAPDQLLHPNAMQFVDMAIRNLAFEFLVPKAPHDPGVNQPGKPQESIPRELLEQAKEDGIDPKILFEEIKALRGDR